MYKSQAEEFLRKVKDNEQIFILRGQDALAPIIVTQWAELAAKMGVPTTKVLEAFHCAEAMRASTISKKIPD